MNVWLSLRSSSQANHASTAALCAAKILELGLAGPCGEAEIMEPPDLASRKSRKGTMVNGKSPPHFFAAVFCAS
jgi:hypothetical protein